MRTLLGLFLGLHGIVHLLGFALPWKIATIADAPYKTTLLAGRLDVGDVGMRIVGALWLATAIAFVAAGIGVLTVQPWWRAVAIVVAGVSFGLCVLAWPDAPIGVVLNLVLLALLLSGAALTASPGRIPS
jgi:hypothetical protein